MHPLLERQIRRHLGDGVDVPEDWRPFLEVVDNAYQQADADSRLGGAFPGIDVAAN